MTFKETMSMLFSTAEGTYYKWKKEERPIIKLLDKYFSKEELEEFLLTEKISKFENMKYINSQFMINNKDKYLRDFNLLKNNNYLVNDFYFYYLNNLKYKKNFSDKNEIFDEFTLDNYTLSASLNEYLFIDFVEEFENTFNELNDLKKESDYFTGLVGIINDEKNNKEVSDKKIEHDAIRKTIQKKQNIFNYIFNNLHFVQNWTEDMYIFLDFLIKDEFQFFINSDNNELLYHSIGFIVYNNNEIKNLSIKERLEIVLKTYNYFIYNKKLISLNVIKNHILLRLSKSDEVERFDDEIKNYKKNIIDEEASKKVEKMMDYFVNNPISINKI